MVWTDTAKHRNKGNSIKIGLFLKMSSDYFNKFTQIMMSNLSVEIAKVIWKIMKFTQTGELTKTKSSRLNKFCTSQGCSIQHK